MPRIFWNASEKEVSQGLDILGYRQVDQNVEKAWVSGITTISIRARYIALVPWLVAMYYERNGLGSDDKIDEPDYDEFLRLNRRLDFVVLACTRHLDEERGEHTVGLIGPDVYEDELASLLQGEAVELELNQGAGSYATYVAPARAFGLISYEYLPSSWASKLTDRTRGLCEVRSTVADGSRLVNLILDGGTVSRDIVAEEAPLFATNALADAGCEPERKFLAKALFQPEPTQDRATYDRFAQTVMLVLQAAREGHPSSADLIARVFRDTLRSASDLQPVHIAWARYDLHRRVHYALELLLCAVTAVVSGRDGARMAEVLDEWAADELPSGLSDFLGLEAFSWNMLLADFADCIRHSEMTDSRISRLAGVPREPCGAAAAFALAILVSCWQETSSVRKEHGAEDDGAGLCKAFPIIEENMRRPLAAVTTDLVNQCVVEAHLATTLRKMGAGLKCSLRFFPDGSTLRPTGVPVGPGYSGDRLGNVIGWLTDLGFLDRESGLTARSDGLLEQLGGSDG